MSKYFLTILFSCLATFSMAQISYYKGEWTKVNTTERFSGVFKLSVSQGSSVKGEFLWTFLAADSGSTEMLNYYKGKKGREGIEYTEGTISVSSGDLYLEGQTKNDPDAIIGLDKYTLKLSADHMVLYGKTDSNGGDNGLFYGVKISAAEGLKAFASFKK